MLKTLILLVFIFERLHAQNPIHYEIKDITINEVDSAFTLNCSYPQIRGLQDSTAQTRCNYRIDSMITDWVESFRSLAREADEEGRGDTNWVGGSNEDIGYDVTLANDRILSLDFSEYGFVAGSAHPGGSSSSITFDLQTGQELQLADLFEPNSAYLDTLDRYCVPERTKGHAGSEIRLKDHYSNYILDQESITIVYDLYTRESYGSYQIPYSVTIPYDELRNILKKHGPIESLLAPAHNTHKNGTEH